MTVLSSAAVTTTAAAPAWPGPIGPVEYDRSPTLTTAERAALERLG